MSEEIIKVLNDLGERFGIAIDWTSQNVMSYLQDLASRYMTYNNLIAIIQIAISVILIIIGIVCIIKLIKWRNSKNYNDSYLSDDPLMCGLGITGASILIALAIGLIIGNTMGIIQNVCMPEMIILDYMKNFRY